MSFNTSTVLAFASDTGAGFSTTGVGSDSIDSGTWSLQKSPTATIVSESQSEPFAFSICCKSSSSTYKSCTICLRVTFLPGRTPVSCSIIPASSSLVTYSASCTFVAVVILLIVLFTNSLIVISSFATVVELFVAVVLVLFFIVDSSLKVL